MFHVCMLLTDQAFDAIEGIEGIRHCLALGCVPNKNALLLVIGDYGRDDTRTRRVSDYGRVSVAFSEDGDC
jgi:hypothetical protein